MEAYRYYNLFFFFLALLLNRKKAAFSRLRPQHHRNFLPKNNAFHGIERIGRWNLHYFYYTSCSSCLTPALSLWTALAVYLFKNHPMYMRSHVHYLHPCGRWKTAQHYMHILVWTAIKVGAKGACPVQISRRIFRNVTSGAKWCSVESRLHFPVESWFFQHVLSP